MLNNTDSDVTFETSRGTHFPLALCQHDASINIAATKQTFNARSCHTHGKQTVKRTFIKYDRCAQR